jgi:hypothetical protein
VLLAVLLVLAVGAQGPARFSGVRWLPHWHLSQRPTKQTAIQRPPMTHGPMPQGKPGHFPTAVTVVLVVLAAAVVALVALVLVRRLLGWWRARPGHAELVDEVAELVDGTEEAVPAEPPEPDARTVLRGLALALSVLEEDREPDDAIVAAWLGLEEAAEDAGVHRFGSETPTEFAARIITRTSTDAAAAKRLLGLYQKVRFGGHDATPDDVAAARECLGALSAAWREAEPDRTRSGRWR